MTDRRLSTHCGICHYCGFRVYPVGSAEALANPYVQRTRDHVKPAVQGYGLAGNMVVACRGCNEIKGPHPARVFEYFMRHTSARTFHQKKHAFNEFCYELAEFGLIASIARINWIKTQDKDIPAATRDARGRFTASDLRMSRSRRAAIDREARQ